MEKTISQVRRTRTCGVQGSNGTYRSGEGNLLGLQALWTFLDDKGHTSSFVKCAIAIGFDRGEVDEHVFAILAGNKPKALRSIEPFHGSGFFHKISLSTMNRPMAFAPSAWQVRW